MTLKRRDLEDGPAWEWRSYLGIDNHTVVVHQLQLVDDRGRWVQRERYDEGGWVARELDPRELPIPADDDEAAQLAERFSGQEAQH